MRKRVALFANGWTNENLYSFMDGLRNNLKEDSADIYAFISYESYGQSPEDRSSQRMAYKLPNLNDFDAAVVFYPGLNFPESISYIYDAIDKAKIPAISICNKRDGYYNIGVDNYSGMLELCNHIIEEHHCKKSVFIAGSQDNTDSNERLAAVTDSLKSHNLTAPTVFYSNWEVGNTMEYLQTNFTDRDSLPDVIFCANDSLATFAVLAFGEKGYSVPQDYLVTGFDYTQRGQIFFPSIASVDQHFDKVGASAAKALSSIFDSIAIDKDIIVPCSFKPAESCGCAHACNSENLRREYSHNFPYRDQVEFLFKGRMFAIEDAFLRSTDYTELKANIRKLYSNGIGLEGSLFCIMMDPLLENIGKDFNYSSYSYCDEMDVIYSNSLTDKVLISKCKTTKLVPYCNELKGNQLFIFSPLFFEDYICGYITICNTLSVIDNYQLYDYENKINRILVSYKRNMQLNELNLKLSELMEQDSLTRVKNRTAYEKYLKSLERDFIEGENDPFAVIYFDINNLKTINDRYGHEKGDAYIKNSCKLMCNTFKHSPVFRIGGDEFVCIAINDDFKNRHDLLSQMREQMIKLKEKGESVPLTERISIASGMAEYDRTLDENFASIFKRADEIMYENKYKMKQEF